MRNENILRQVIHPEEQFIWMATGSVADVKYNPLYLLLAIVTLGVFVLILYLVRIYHVYVLTNQRLLVITGIFGKKIDEIELFRVVDSLTQQSFFDRLADLGTVTVQSTDKTGDLIMHKIPSPYQKRDALRRAYVGSRQQKGTVVLESLAG